MNMQKMLNQSNNETTEILSTIEISKRSIMKNADTSIQNGTVSRNMDLLGLSNRSQRFKSQS